MVLCPGCKKPYVRLNTHTGNCPAYAAAMKATREGLIDQLKHTDLEVESSNARKRARLLEPELAGQQQAENTSGLALPSPIPLDEDIDIPHLPILPEPIVDHDSAPLPAMGRPSNRHRRPARLHDSLPEPTVRLPLLGNPPTMATRIRLIVRDTLYSEYNSFSMRRLYQHRPSYEPDAFLSTRDLVNQGHRTTPEEQPRHISTPSITPTEPNAPPKPSFWPFTNISTWLYMRWINNGNTTKSASEVDALVHDVLLHPEFKCDELKGFRSETENSRFERAATDSDNPLFQSFRQSSVHIKVPSGESGVDPQDFEVPNLLHRTVMDVVRGAFQESLAHRMHLSPYRLLHRPPGATEDIRIYGELYTSDAFIQEDDNVRLRGKLPPGEQGCTLEKVIAAIMLFSDATHLANFGTAKAWPIYLALGNLSKYLRAKPTADSIFHLAYVPSLPDSFQDWVSERFPHWNATKAGMRDLKALCKRDLMHGVWEILLDDDFVHAYMYGVVIECVDGVKRRVYPRIFTYSADYPEKVLLATIRDKGMCPCPRCMIAKDKLDGVGLRRDSNTRTNQLRSYLWDKVVSARRAIFDFAHAISGTWVQNLLKESSGVPTLNAFVQRIGREFNPYKMMVVDLLHEIELGVWKALFTHLIRIVHAQAKKSRTDLVGELDRRYRTIKSFGRATIRRFSSNSSEMKKLAARDFEDLLQCSIPVFEDLLPEPTNSSVMTMLYRFAEWHAFSKLRMHTDVTLTWLEKATIVLGGLLRSFRDKVCPDFDTVELPREAAARARAAQRRQTAPGSDTPGSTSSGSKRKTFNLHTYKFHAMGDYVSHVRIFGTLDSYSTQMGELAHRTVKALYSLTNKKDTALKQVSQKYTRMRALRHMEADEERTITSVSPEVHHTISDNRNEPHDIYSLVKDSIDPAKKRFIPKLKDHILGRLQGMDFDGDETQFSDSDRTNIKLVNNRIYEHHVMRVNYTTYDVMRDYDTINPRSQCFIMLKSPEDDAAEHPYWHAQVIKIYHADVQWRGPDSTDLRPRAMHFLYVRWLGREPGWKSGRRVARLPKIGFVPDEDDYAFGFLDPVLVIRGAHLIPAFANGRTSSLLSVAGPTLARQDGEDDDWTNYYVNMYFLPFPFQVDSDSYLDRFVDRDMVMRYYGGGVGHVGVPVLEDATTEDTDIDDMDVDDGSGDAEGRMDDENSDTDSDDSDDDDEDDSDSDISVNDSDDGYDDL